MFCAACHHSSDCRQKCQVRCVNCWGDHKASDTRCPEAVLKVVKQSLPSLNNNKSAVVNSVQNLHFLPKQNNEGLKKARANNISSNNHKGTSNSLSSAFAKTSSSCHTDIPSLFSVKYTQVQVQTLFPSNQYPRIAKKLFPSLYNRHQVDRNFIPVAVTTDIVSRVCTDYQIPKTYGYVHTKWHLGIVKPSGRSRSLWQVILIGITTKI